MESANASQGLTRVAYILVILATKNVRLAKDPQRIARAAMTGTYFQARLVLIFRQGLIRGYAGVLAGLAKGKAQKTAQAATSITCTSKTTSVCAIQAPISIPS
jgi:hypothetical protein